MANGIQEIIKTAQSPVVIFKPDVPDNLSTLSWDEIKQHSDKAKEDPEKYYQCLGLFAPQLTLDGCTYDVKLVDIGRYDKVSGGKTGFDFLCIDLATDIDGKYPWHDTFVSNGIDGYRVCSLRAKTLPMLYNLMPGQLKSNIAQVKYMSAYSVNGVCSHSFSDITSVYHGSYDANFELLQDYLHEVAIYDLWLNSTANISYSQTTRVSSNNWKDDVTFYSENAGHVLNISSPTPAYAEEGYYLPMYPFKVWNPVFILENKIEALESPERRYLAKDAGFALNTRSSWARCYLLSDIYLKGGYDQVYQQNVYPYPFFISVYQNSQIPTFSVNANARPAKWALKWSDPNTTSVGFKDNIPVWANSSRYEMIESDYNKTLDFEKAYGHLAFVFSLS